MDLNKFVGSKTFKLVIFIVLILIATLIVFRLGMAVGFYKANFSCAWGNNYQRNFAGPREGLGPINNDRNFLDSHGTIGRIIKIDGTEIVISRVDQAEKVILINDKTEIVKFRDELVLSDLSLEESVVVVGEPNADGQIVARLIRVMPNNLPEAPMPPRP